MERHILNTLKGYLQLALRRGQLRAHSKVLEKLNDRYGCVPEIFLIQQMAQLHGDIHPTMDDQRLIKVSYRSEQLMDRHSLNKSLTN